MAARSLLNQRLVSLFVLGWVLFTFPMLSIFNTDDIVLGIPLLYAYLFAVWALLIILMSLAVARVE